MRHDPSMAGDQDMREMLNTRHKPRLRTVTVSTAVGDGTERIVHSESPPHLSVARMDDAQVAPPFSEQHGAPIVPSPTLADSPAAAAVRGWFVQSLLVEAIVRDEAGEVVATADVLEHALEVAAHDRALVPFLIDPIPQLLERHARYHSAHAELISEILGVRAGLADTAQRQASESLPEPLTESETRVLRLLATDLSKREIGNELHVSVNTVKTHAKHLYAKLDVQTRHQAVERARALGLLTHSTRKPLSLVMTRSG